MVSPSLILLRKIRTPVWKGYSLLSIKSGVCVRRIARHSIVQHVLGVCDCVAPERRRLDLEVAYYGIEGLIECQSDRSTVPIRFYVGREILP